MGNINVPGLVLGTNMNILLLSRYTRLGASSRLRTMQYLPELLSHGFKIEIAPFFDDAYLNNLYSGQRNKISVIKNLVDRLKIIKKKPHPDMIWIEKEVLPWIPWFIENSLLPKNVPIISDYDDAVFHRYDMHKNKIIKSILGNKIKKVMRSSSLVMVGNPYLQDYAINSGAKRVFIIPTVVDLKAYDICKKPLYQSKPRVGWIGTPQTWQELANPIHKVLDPVLKKHDSLFRAVGAKMNQSESGTLEIIPWKEESEVELIKTMDIGVMPLPDNPWTRGKCGYKLIQYMACGIPVVASSVGVNRNIIEDGINGFLVKNENEWRDAINLLLNDSNLRNSMGAAGRKKVQEEYSLQTWSPRLIDMILLAREN